MTVGQIEQMPIAEYLGWQEFYDIEPWGIAVQDSLNGYAISALANVNRDSKARPKAYSYSDFLLFTQQDEPEPVLILHEDPDKQTEAMIAGQFGGMKVQRF